MEMKLDVTYKIEKGDTWRHADSLKIVSNIANDEMIDCQISKSLVDFLKKESAILEPDKLLLGFAEAQKRGIEDNLSALNELDLRAKTMADSIQEKLLKSYEDAEEKYSELEKKFSATRKKFVEKLAESKESLDKEMLEIDAISKKLSAIDNYGLERLTETLKQVISLVEKDREIVKLVLEQKSKQPRKLKLI